MSFHKAIIRDFSDFEPDSFRTEGVESGIEVTIGTLTDDGEETAQAYTFDVGQFNPSEAQSWLADQGIEPLSFEEAEGDQDEPAESSAVLDLVAEFAMEPVGSGKLPRFSILAYTGGVLRLPNYQYGVVVDLQGLDVPNQARPVRFQHDALRGVGHTDSIQNDGTTLTCAGLFSRQGADTNDILASSKKGFPWQASIGCSVEKKELLQANQTAFVNGQKFQGPLIIARRTTLREVSIVDAGADDSTRVSIAAKYTRKKTMSTATSPTAKILAAWNQADISPEIRAQHQDTLTAALDGKLGFSQFETTLARAETATARASNVRGNRPGVDGMGRGAPAGLGSNIIEAAMLIHTGHEALGVKTLGAQTMQMGRELRCRSFMDVIQAAMRAEHRELPVGTDAIIQAAISTTSLPGILSNSMNKVLLSAYQTVPSVAKQIARKLTTNDFKTHTGYRITGDVTFDEVGAGGELKHGTLGEQAFTYSAKTFGKIIGISRKEMVNDDLGAFDSIPQSLGRGAALALEESFWALVLANTGDFFGTGNNNFLDGADSALGLVGLGDGVAKMLNQTDTLGKPLALVPRFLVCPPCLKATADSLYRSTTTIVGGASSADQMPSANSFFGLSEPMPTPYLSNVNYTGNSTTAWYLFADAGDVAAFGVAYLDGNEQPTIQSGEASFDVLGLSWRAFFDFGICQLDPRGALKSKGTT